MQRSSGSIWLLACWFGFFAWPAMAAGEDPGRVQQLEEMVVEEKGGAPGIDQEPFRTVIDLEEFQSVGPRTSVLDVLETRSIVDFRGESDLDPGVDSVFLRGFDAKRFAVAIDDLTLQKTGGRRSSNIVDYALLPTFLVEKVEILPGPHSALFDSKSIGGVIHLITAKPRPRESLRPEGRLTASYGSYHTTSQVLSVRGGAANVTYDAALRNYATDGYLRHNETDIETVFGRLGYLLPHGGFVTFSASASETDREVPVNNTGNDYDSDDPRVEDSAFDPFQDPTWDGRSYTYRLDVKQPSPIGRLSLGAYYGKDNRVRAYFENPGDAVPSEMDTDWWQEGGKLMDEIAWAENHTTSLGIDYARLFDEGLDDDKEERIQKKGAFLQHQWGVLPSLDLTLGLRYEAVQIRVSNESGGNLYIPGRPRYIGRDFSQLVPKSFATWRLDELAPWLRDTSLSLGVSRIWRAPDTHGDYNPQGRPAGAWLDPEHGTGWDLILTRRLWRDIGLTLGYAFYDIEDFIATNSSYARFSGANAGSLRFSDYKVNLAEVHRHGIDVELGGHLLDRLSFFLSYAWQDFENQGDEPAGETELDQRAEHRVSAGLRYALCDRTTLLVDYDYQSDEVTEISEEIAPDVYDFREVEIDAYHVVDVGVRQVLCARKGVVENVVLNLYIQNLFDKRYYNASGFPATDRFYGASLSVAF